MNKTIATKQLEFLKSHNFLYEFLFNFVNHPKSHDDNVNSIVDSFVWAETNESRSYWGHLDDLLCDSFGDVGEFTRQEIEKFLKPTLKQYPELLI